MNLLIEMVLMSMFLTIIVGTVLEVCDTFGVWEKNEEEDDEVHE